MNIGESIRTVRKARKMTQIEVAEKAGFSVNSLRLYEAGKREPSFSQICTLSEVFDVPLAELIPNFSSKEQEIWKTSWLYGYEDRTEEFREEVNFACDELKRRTEDPHYFLMLLLYERLNDEGRKKVVGYAEDLVTTGKYKSSTPIKPLALQDKNGWFTTTTEIQEWQGQHVATERAAGCTPQNDKKTPVEAENPTDVK